MEVGDVQIDLDGSEWVIISIVGRDRVSRIRKNSLAHRVHAESSEIIARSLDKEVNESATTSAERSDTSG